MKGVDCESELCVREVERQHLSRSQSKKWGGDFATTHKAPQVECRQKINDAGVRGDATFREHASGDATLRERAPGDATLQERASRYTTASQSMTVAGAATAAETQKLREKPAGKHVPAGKPVL